jgi:hypothetical protein
VWGKVPRCIYNLEMHSYSIQNNLLTLHGTLYTLICREMVEVFIAYEKRKADPRNLKAEAEANLSDPSTWGTYAIWITGGAGFAYIKNVIIEPKYRSGEWEEIHIPLPGAGMFGQNAADAALQSADTVSSVVDAASSAM